MASGKRAVRVQARRTSADERAAVIEEFRASGLRQAEFAASRDLKLGTLQGWLYGKRPGSGRGDGGGRFFEVVENSAGSPATSVLLLVRLGSAVLEFSELPPTEWLVALCESPSDS